MDKIEELYSMLDGIEYGYDAPEDAIEFAKENNLIFIMGGSDDLMYCYGSHCFLTDEGELPFGWDGCNLTEIEDDNEYNKAVKWEAKQLGLKIFWCGNIKYTGEGIKNYSIEESGSFSYQVNPSVKSKTFKVIEDGEEIYCTGSIIELPDDFETAYAHKEDYEIHG